MPRYHFDLDDGRLVVDADGLELPDRAAVRKEAARRAAAFISALAEHGVDGAVVVRVRAASGASVLSVMLASLIEDTPVAVARGRTCAPDGTA